MFLNIITPCSRPQNLLKISESINIPKENYRWIVVCDSLSLPDENLIPKNCEIYCHKNINSIVGNSQRNYAIDMVDHGHVYFLDDDTLIHNELWENIKDLEDDFISFIQIDKNRTVRLVSNVIEVGGIDTGNFIVSHKIIGNSRWINLYYGDGVFAKECYLKSKKILHINKPLSIYNLISNMHFAQPTTQPTTQQAPQQTTQQTTQQTNQQTNQQITPWVSGRWFGNLNKSTEY